MQLAQIPEELRESRQWVNWKLVAKNGDKPTKIPVTPDGSAASTTDPDTWRSFGEAASRAEEYSGIGFVFSPNDPYCGIDLDGCRDPKTGRIADWARYWITELDSYSEISPSGTGVKVWVKAKWPLETGKKRFIEAEEIVPGKKPAIEVYDHARYFCVTGMKLNRLPDEPQERQAAIDKLYHKHFANVGTRTDVPTPSDDPNRTPLAVVERARRYLATMPGAISGQGGHDQTFHAACVLVLGFCLTRTEALLVLSEYNQRCEPKWTEKELEHKVDSAGTQPGVRGYLRDARESDWSRVKVPDYAEPEPPQEPTHQPEWEAPIEFHDVDLPPFPISTLPDCLREYCEALSVATQTPVDMAAMLSLAAVSTACAKIVKIQADTWISVVNIYTVVVLPVANRKSAVFEAIAAPIEEYERRQGERLKPEIAESQSNRKVKETRLSWLHKKAAEAKTPTERQQHELEARDLAIQLSATPVAVQPRYLADDITPEQLVSIMAGQGGRIAIMSAEGDIFEIIAGRYSQTGPNLNIYLKAHNGDDHRVDRVGRTSEWLRKPALTLALTVQPEVIRDIGSKPGFRGRGLLGRILYSIPKSTVGFRLIKPPGVLQELQDRYRNTITQLLEMPYPSDEYGPIPRCLTLSDGADELFTAYQHEIEPKLAPGAELCVIADWAGKLCGTVLRISALLHMATHAYDQEPWSIPISSKTMANAIQIGIYLLEHAKAAFGEMKTDPATDDARYILDWIKRTDKKEFTKRDAYKSAGRRFQSVQDIEAPFRILIERSFIREKAVPKSQKAAGRPASPTYESNPAVFGTPGG